MKKDKIIKLDFLKDKEQNKLFSSLYTNPNLMKLKANLLFNKLNSKKEKFSIKNLFE